MHRHLTSLLAASALAVGVPIATAAPALAHNTSSVQIPNRNWSDNCLEVDYARSYDGAAVTVDKCWHNGSNQRWRLADLGNGYHHVIVEHTGKCLTVRYGSHDDGAQIEQRTCSLSRQSQQWKHVPTSSGYSSLVARHSGKCLDKSWWNTVQWNCHGASWQQWKVS